MVPTGGGTFCRKESVGCLVQLCIKSRPVKLLGAERSMADASSPSLSLLGDDEVSTPNHAEKEAHWKYPGDRTGNGLQVHIDRSDCHWVVNELPVTVEIKYTSRVVRKTYIHRINQGLAWRSASS
jgi:hypothetical protein